MLKRELQSLRLSSSDVFDCSKRHLIQRLDMAAHPWRHNHKLVSDGTFIGDNKIVGLPSGKRGEGRLNFEVRERDLHFRIA